MIYIKQASLINSNIEEELFPYNLPAMKNISKLVFDAPITCITGENGVGKSTIVEAIATAFGFNPEGGNKNIQFETYASHSDLYANLKLIKLNHPKTGFFFRTETMYGLLTMIEEYFTDWKIHENSHGQAALELVQRYFKPNGLYILDEPESGLSPTSQFTFLKIIYDLAKNHQCQFIIATHSPIILGLDDAKIYEIHGIGDISEVEYDDSSIYNLYKRFLLSKEYRTMIQEE